MSASLLFAIGQFLLTSLIALGLWLNRRGEEKGRTDQKQENVQQSDDRRIAALEATQVDVRRIVALETAMVDEHILRRDVNRDVGRLDVRLSKAEVRVEDHARRLERVEAERA